MKTSTYFTSNIKKGIVHLIVLLIAITTTTIIPSSFPAKRWHVYIMLTLIIAYYIHSLVFLPILIRKKNLKKYLLLTIGSIILIAFTIIWFQANLSSIITIRFDGTLSEPSDFYFNKQWIIGGLAIAFTLFVPFSLVSLAYYLLIINSAERKELFSMKYTEFIVNIIVVASLIMLVLANSIGNKNATLFLFFAFAFYINTFVYTPSVLKSRNVIKYVLLNLASFLLIVIGVKFIYGSSFINISNLSGNFIDLIAFFLIALILSFIYGYVRLKLKNNERLFHIKLDAKNSELQLLKSQVNPHFLFNTLNTLYATALNEKAEKTAESTAKLANLLRYMQNDISKDFIPLKNEINYLEDYIVIQKLRCAVEPKVKTVFKNITNQIISPGLLIPFVENAFKYGIDPSKNSELTISIICDESNIYFTCTNTYNENFKVHKVEEGFGIGIKNAKYRLELVYPNKHNFEILKENNIFSVKLTILTQDL